MTVIVAFENMHLADNHMVLPNKMEEGYRNILTDDVLIHKDVDTSMKHTVKTNYDILVYNYMADNEAAPHESSYPVPVVKLPRYSKSTQQRILHSFYLNNSVLASKLGFRVIPTWKFKDAPYIPVGLTSYKLVRKPEYGARGIGQLVLVPRLGTTMQAMIVAAMKMKNDELKAEGNIDIGIGKIINLKGEENWDGEGDQYTNPEYCFYQEWLEMDREWRLLLDINGKISYSHERAYRSRSESDDGYRQAYEAHGEVERNPHLNEMANFFGGQVQPILDRLNKNGDFCMASVDIYMDHAGNWGILEWQPQTGIGSLPEDVVMKYHVEFIEALVQKVNRHKGLIEENAHLDSHK